MRAAVALAFLLFAASASAQFGGIDLGRALDIGKKVVKGAEASRDLSTDEEIALGEAVTAGFLGAAPLHPDPGLQRYVNRVGKWLAYHSDRRDLPWAFGVIDTETINAFAMPGGYVIVSSGLVKRLATESELAGVLAHEIAHVVKRHQISAIQSSKRSDVFTSITKEIAADQISRRGGGYAAQQVKTWASNAAQELIKDGFFLRPLDRSMEYEADDLAITIATRAGYEPYGLVSALQMLAQHKGEGDAASVFSTHPAAADRIAELERLAPLMERYATHPNNEQRFRQAVRALR
jgi:beta-barrel assembly-enhancing protease